MARDKYREEVAWQLMGLKTAAERPEVSLRNGGSREQILETLLRVRVELEIAFLRVEKLTSDR